MQLKLSKFIATMLAVIILSANSWPVVSYAADVFLSENELENQNTTSKDGSVGFDVHYADGKHSAKLDLTNAIINGNKYEKDADIDKDIKNDKNSTSKNETSTNTVSSEKKISANKDKEDKTDINDSTESDIKPKINISISAKKEGYIKEATIDFSTANFEIAQINESDKIQKFDVENKRITFGQINNKQQITEQIAITPINKDEVSENNFNKDNHIKLIATFVNTDAKETKIEQEIIVHTEWFAKEPKAELNYEVTKYIPYLAESGSQLIIQGKVTSKIKDDVLPVKETKINIDVPQIANEYPSQINVINTTEENAKEVSKENYTYNSKNGTLIIDEKTELLVTKNKDNNSEETDQANNSIKNIDEQNIIKGETSKTEINNAKVETSKTQNDNTKVEENKIQWPKNKPQEYTITYMYSSKVYETIKEENVELNYNINSEVTLYGNEDKTVKAELSVTKQQKEKLGEIADITAENAEDETIYKGYLYNNKVTADENKRETEVTNKYTLNIAYADIIDTIKITQDDDKFTTDNSKEYKANIYNKELKLSKQEFNNIFGEDGKIEIKSKDGIILSTISKDTKSEQNEIKVDLSSTKTENIIIETSKPKTEGILNLEINKAIEKDNEYNINEIKEFTNLKSSMNIVAQNADTEILNETTETVTKLEEPSPKVKIVVDKDRLSTVTTNEIAIGITIENDSLDDVMFVNPNFKIILPKYIEKLDVGEAEIMFDNELKVTETKTYDNEDGTKTIEVQLEGKQTVFSNPVAKGAMIIVGAGITLNEYTPTMDTKIKVIAQNGDENKTTAEGEIAIKYVAPSGVITTNSVTGYNENEKLEVINGEAKEAVLPAKSEAKELTFEMNIINNYENTLDNAVIFGRTMFKGNKDVDTLNDLGSTMDIPMSSKITVENVPQENVEIYYSANETATKDLMTAENGWNTEVTDYSTIKSYMIVLKNYTLKSGKTIKFSYKAQAPANLDYLNKAYEMYGIYFKNNISTGTIDDKAIATKIGLNTGKEAVLSANLESTIGEGGSVKSGEKLQYELTIDNNGTVSADDTTINIDIPNNLEYVPEDGENYRIRTIMPLTKTEVPEEPDWDKVNWDKSEVSKEEAMEMWKEQVEAAKEQAAEYEKWVEEQKAQGVEFDENLTEQKNILIITVGNIKINQVITKKLTFTTKHVGYNTEDEIIKLKATVEYNEDMKAETNEVTNIIKINFFNVEIYSNNQDKIQVGDTYECLINISTNDYENDAINTILKLTLPGEMEYKSVTYESGTIPNKVNVKNNIIEINLGTLEKGNTKQLVLKLNVKDLPDGIYKKDVSITGTIKADGRSPEEIPELTDTINKIGANIIQSCNIPANATISAGEKYTYTFTISNLSEIPLDDVILTDKLPDEIQLKKVEAIYSDGTKSTEVKVNENGEMQISLSLLELGSVNVNVEVMAKSLTKDTTITNKGKITHEKIGEKESNSITHIIELFDKNNVDPDKPSYTKKITGTVWIDKNKDGTKDTDEEKIAGVTVILIDQNGNIVKNEKKSDCVATTDSDGNYLFNYLYSGTYTVIFLYESSMYSATTYKKEGVDENLNSDAVDKIVVFEGEQRIAGVTEIIKVTNSNIYNIDLGLIENTKFDLKLDKTVKVITTNNGKQVVEHTYENKLAKIDFEAKYVDQSSMVIEYSITVTNEGGVAGYAKKIADYIPEEFKFNSELNKDWYEGANGTVYNSSLANTIINPGESKTVTLTLTKNMNSEDFGVFSNSAEIYEASNNYGLLDIDSIPGNRASNEDDYSIANVIIGVKTGQTVIYVTLTLAVLAIISTGAYVIKKKILK